MQATRGQATGNYQTIAFTFGSWQAQSLLVGYLNVLGTWAFLSTCFVESNALSFTKFVVSCSFNAAGMKEQVLVSANVNEPKTFISKSLNSAFGHYDSLKVEQYSPKRNCPIRTSAELFYH